MKSKKLETSSMHTRARRLLRSRSHSRPPQPPRGKIPVIIISDSDESMSEEESSGESQSSEREVKLLSKLKEEYQSKDGEESGEETEEEEEETEDVEEETEDDEETEENESGEDDKNEGEKDEIDCEIEVSWDRKATINESGAGEHGESVEFFCVESSAGSIKIVNSSYINRDNGNLNTKSNDNFSCVGNNAESATFNMVEKKKDNKEQEKEASINSKAGSEKSKSVECVIPKTVAEETTTVLKPTYACTVPETRRGKEVAKDSEVDKVVMMDAYRKESIEEVGIDNELPSKDKIATKTHRGQNEVGTSKSLKKIKRVKKDKMSRSEFLDYLTNIDRNDGGVNAYELDKENTSLTTDFNEHTILPVLFSFGDDDEKVVEKTEQELEEEELWREYDLALAALNIGVYNDEQRQSEGTDEQTCELNEASLCEKGMHKYIIDDQIGIKCMLCSYVQMDIKYVFPSWDFNSGNRFGPKDKLIEEIPSLLNEIPKTNTDCQISQSHFDGTVWDLIPGIKDSMFPHQIEAFEFMWNNLAGTIQIDELKKHIDSDETGGCVISHAPGTGKTKLSIMFLKSFLNYFPDCRPVIVAPPGLLQTWKNEFKKWRVDIEIHDLNDDRSQAYQENVMEHAILPALRDTRTIRLGKLLSWSKCKSVILVSYNLLAQKESEFNSFLLEKAGLIIFDEGHTPRNDRSMIWSELTNIQTSKRIILSGTPFQNNFQELYTTLRLVRPKFADKLSSKTFKRPCNTTRAEKAKKKGKFVEKDDAKSKWDILTKNVNANDNDLKMNIDEVRSIIAPFVHVHGGKILDTLPGLRKCMLILNPLPQQNVVRDKMNKMKSKCQFEEDYRNTLAAIHPSLVMAFLSEEDKLAFDIDMLKRFRLCPNKGAKTNFIFELIRLCISLNEKIIIFCQYIEPLDLIRDQLMEIFGWTEGKEILKLVGGLLTKSRQSRIDTINDDSSSARVVLASTKACSEGISLVGASRVVLLDILWNPATEFQAISRAHRIGQKRIVYVYQLITFGMKENEKYGVQANKKKISNLVFAPTIDGDFVGASSSNLEELDTGKLIAEDKVLQEMTGHDEFRDVFQKIYFLSKETSVAFAYNVRKI